MFQLYDIAKAKEDHQERMVKADAIKADIAKTLDAVFDANNVLQVKGITVSLLTCLQSRQRLFTFIFYQFYPI